MWFEGSVLFTAKSILDFNSYFIQKCLILACSTIWMPKVRRLDVTVRVWSDSKKLLEEISWVHEKGNKGDKSDLLSYNFS